MSQQYGAYRVALTASDTAGGVAAVANPEGVSLIITRLVLRVATVATGAATVDAGVAANATTSADNLVDGLDVNAATGVFGNVGNPGTNGRAQQLWTSSQFLTVSRASGATAGLVGYLYIEYMRA